MNKVKGMSWDMGRVSRPTTKGYRVPVEFQVPIVIKPATQPKTRIGTVTRVKGEKK